MGALAALLVGAVAQTCLSEFELLDLSLSDSRTSDHRYTEAA